MFMLVHNTKRLAWQLCFELFVSHWRTQCESKCFETELRFVFRETCHYSFLLSSSELCATAVLSWLWFAWLCFVLALICMALMCFVLSCCVVLCLARLALVGCVFCMFYILFIYRCHIKVGPGKCWPLVFCLRCLGLFPRSSCFSNLPTGPLTPLIMNSKVRLGCCCFVQQSVCNRITHLLFLFIHRAVNCTYTFTWLALWHALSCSKAYAINSLSHFFYSLIELPMKLFNSPGMPRSCGFV